MKRKRDEGEAPRPEAAQRLADDVFPLVAVPFYGRPRIMRLRRLSQNQARASIGDVALSWGENQPGAGANAQSVADVVTILDHMDNAAKAVMVDPTYDQLVAEMDRMRPDGARTNAIAEIDRIRSELENYSDPNHPEVISLQALADEIRSMECYPLPEDCYGFLFAFATHADGLDMRVFTRERMLSAAAQGEKYGERPCDIVGIEEDRGLVREDFDRCATYELATFRKEHAAVKKGGSAGVIRRG